MSLLFEPFKMGPLELKNRFVRSATTSYWADRRGVLRPEIIDLYRTLAQGGVGLIIKGHLFVTDAGKAHAGMAGISQDYHLPRLRELTAAVHRHEGHIVAQLNHGGMYSIVDRAGPSTYVVTGSKARALAAPEVRDIIEAFGTAAERALAAGFDGVQIHGAHGYLISQFLSRRVNRRTDEWGGPLKNRKRLLLAVYDAIRRRLGGRVPILLKLNCDDFAPAGFTLDEAALVGAALCQRRLTALEVSGGGVGRQDELRARARSPDPVLREASFAGHAAAIRRAITPTPLALVGGIRSLTCMKALVRQDVADLISMSRPFIREPDLVRRLEAGQQASTCTSCNLCRAEEVFGKTMLRCHLA
jgi:2,4-dienoyl-CoA reductase-like NADH-dependent reductase (Old Yellow Enzyme family)